MSKTHQIEEPKNIFKRNVFLLYEISSKFRVDPANRGFLLDC